MAFFQGSSNVNAYNPNFYQIDGNANLNHIHGNITSNITIIRFGDDQFTQDQRNWIRDIISTHVALPDINHNLNRNFLTQFIINLPRAEAVFNDYQNKKKSGQCFEGTRVALLCEMADWVTGADESRMYILSGLAGIGKSTVAYTIASRAADLNLLAASFFFSRDEPDRNNAKKLFTTIAYQLCAYNEAFSKAIGDALMTERGSAATTKDPQEQLEALILDPLRSIIQSRTRPILVVVDALDECDEDDGYGVIKGLSQLVQDLPLFKVILTTRPKPYLDFFLRNHHGHKLFHLQEIEDKIVDSDIRLYLTHSLSLEQVRKCCIRGQWCANEEEIDSLVRAAGRLFIIASTTIRYILDKFASNPAGQMKKLLRAFAQDHTPFKDLDHFYTVILRNVVPANCDDDDIVSRYQSVVGTIIFVRQPLSVSILANLIDIDEREIRVVLDHLQSVILLGDDDVPRIYHKSFPDYVIDQARCKDRHLQIDSTASHTLIATCCFQIANKFLKYNILGLSKMARYMNNKDGPKEDGITYKRLQEKIPQHLRYACVYWANHLQFATTENTDLMNGLEKFVDEHTLHWFELLSLIGKLDSAHRALRLVLKIMNSMSSDLQQLLSDALRFILRFYEIIERSALHTYYSALPFSPTDSLLYRRFIKEAEHNIFVIEGGPEKWDARIASPTATAGFGFRLRSIKFSHDSAMVYSCSESYFDDSVAELKIWDAVTGTPISTIPGQRFAVSNDFSTIASSNANTITYYNTNGSERGAMFTISSTVDTLALSESCRIAAALADGTVWLWESRNGELIGNFDGYALQSQEKYDEYEELGILGYRPMNHIYWVKDISRLQFSSTGTRLIYSSANGSVKLRDGMTGQLIADLQCGLGKNFVFSGDGSRIASLSYQCGLTLWSSESGALIGNVKYLLSGGLAISESGSLLATASGSTVMLWSESHGHLAKITDVATMLFSCSMAFSPNNILALGHITCVQLYNTKTHSFISADLSSGVFPVAMTFSPDCTRFAYGSSDRLYLWDIQCIDTSSPPSNELSAFVTAQVIAMALSRDCSRLALVVRLTGSWVTMDYRVELWGTSPTLQRIALSHQADKRWNSISFGPDGRLFASISIDGNIELWNGGDGSFHGTIKAPDMLKKVALSNSMLVAKGDGDVTLWNLDTLSLVHDFQESGEYSPNDVSISDEGDLIAFYFYPDVVNLFHVGNRTVITTFKISNPIQTLTFLPNKSHLVAQLSTGAFLSFNLIDKCTREMPMFEYLIQLPDTPLCDGVPIWYSRAEEQHWFSALFSQHKVPVPVLRITEDAFPIIRTQGSSLVAWCRSFEHIILLRLSTSRKEDGNSQHDTVYCSSRTDTRLGGATSNPPRQVMHFTPETSNLKYEVSGSQETAENHTLNPMNKLSDKESKEEQVKHLTQLGTIGGMRMPGNCDEGAIDTVENPSPRPAVQHVAEQVEVDRRGNYKNQDENEDDLNEDEEDEKNTLPASDSSRQSFNHV